MYKPTYNQRMPINKKAERLFCEEYKKVSDFLIKNANDPIIAKVHKGNFEVTVKELIQNEALTFNLIGQLEFHSDKLSNHYKIIINSKYKLINAIENVCKKTILEYSTTKYDIKQAQRLMRGN